MAIIRYVNDLFLDLIFLICKIRREVLNTPGCFIEYSLVFFLLSFQFLSSIRFIYMLIPPPGPPGHKEAKARTNWFVFAFHIPPIDG